MFSPLERPCHPRRRAPASSQAFPVQQRLVAATLIANLWLTEPGLSCTSIPPLRRLGCKWKALRRVLQSPPLWLVHLPKLSAAQPPSARWHSLHGCCPRVPSEPAPAPHPRSHSPRLDSLPEAKFRRYPPATWVMQVAAGRLEALASWAPQMPALHPCPSSPYAKPAAAPHGGVAAAPTLNAVTATCYCPHLSSSPSKLENASLAVCAHSNLPKWGPLFVAQAEVAEPAAAQGWESVSLGTPIGERSRQVKEAG